MQTPSSTKSTNKGDNDYQLLVATMQALSSKVDIILEKFESLGNKVIILEEWRKYVEDDRSQDRRQINQHDSRISALENYRWFLLGVSTIIGTLFGILAAIGTVKWSA